MSSAVPNRGGREETLGERLRRLRLERGLSQRAISAPGVSSAYISRVEHGERQPSVKALRLLAGKLGVTADYLETGLELSPAQRRELALGQAELELRFGDRPAATERRLRGLLDEAVAAGDEAAASRAQIALGLAASARSAHAEAVSLLEGVVEARQVSPSAHATLYTTLGRSLVALGRHDDAVALYMHCLDVLESEAPVDGGAYVRFATHLSYALADRGDLAGAEAAVKEALEHAGTSGDPYTRVRAYWSRARLAADQGRLALAHRSIARAIALLEASDDTAHLARAHILGAEVLVFQDSLDEARAHLDAAAALLGEGADVEDRGWLQAELAHVAARAGRDRDALEHARAAQALYAGLEPAMQGRAHWALAEALAAAGQTAEAEREFDTAERLCRASHRIYIRRARSRLLATAAGD